MSKLWAKEDEASQNRTAWFLRFSKTPYVAVFQRFGYVTSDKKVHCCKACKQIAKKDCCSCSSRDERLKKELIFNMRLAGLGSDEV
jgi:recombinational DNA repair protein RecR